MADAALASAAVQILLIPLTCTSGVCQIRCWPPSTAIIWPVTASALQQIADRGADIGRFGAMSQDGGVALAGEIGFRLARIAHGGAGPHGIDADARAHALRQGGGEPVKPGLAEAVGKKLRRRLQHPLVDDVDDVAALALRQAAWRISATAATARADWSPYARPSFCGVALCQSSFSNREAELISAVSGPISLAARVHQRGGFASPATDRL